VLGAEARTAAVMPHGAGHGCRHLYRRHAADPAQRIEQLLLFERDLRCGGKMLQHAAAADTEMRALRFGAIGRCAFHRHHRTFVGIAPHLRQAIAHALAGQCAGDEYDLAVDARDAAAVVREISDLGDEFTVRRRPPPSATAHY
jgi:hypothetical protein